MIAEFKMQVSQLIEINQALAHDLDVCHRKAAELARAKEALQDDNEALQIEVKRLAAQERDEGAARVEEQLRGEVKDRQRELARLRHDLEVQRRDAEVARMRATHAEEQFRLQRVKLDQLEQERDALKDQLDESVAAMDEIRSHLIALPAATWPEDCYTP